MLVHESRRHSCDNLPFPSAERIETVAQITYFIVSVAPNAVALDRSSDSVQKVLFTKRLLLPHAACHGQTKAAKRNFLMSELAESGMAKLRTASAISIPAPS
jgi:hypothetical protein